MKTALARRPSPAVSSDAPPAQSTASRRSIRLLQLAVVLGLLHHSDHVLRADHSGWPFIATVTPFTFSLLVYPVFGLAFRKRARPAVSAALCASILAATQYSHIVFESPADQYTTWATGMSPHAHSLHQPNLLHVASPAMGGVAVVLSIVLSVVLVAPVVSFWTDARGQRS